MPDYLALSIFSKIEKEKCINVDDEHQLHIFRNYPSLHHSGDRDFLILGTCTLIIGAKKKRIV